MFQYLKRQFSTRKNHLSKKSNNRTSTDMSKTSLQYQLDKRGGSFTEASVPYPAPGANDICIRNKAVALNPIDWKNRNFGATVQSWPAVLGFDAAGVVESVGESVKDFKTGDEILCLGGMDSRGAAFQEITTVPAHNVAKKPESLTFEEAASLPYELFHSQKDTNRATGELIASIIGSAILRPQQPSAWDCMFRYLILMPLVAAP